MKATYTVTYRDPCGESWDIVITEIVRSCVVGALDRTKKFMGLYDETVKAYHVYAVPYECLGCAYINYHLEIEVA